jgi:Fe-S-cluster-containing hydrogenase component 2
MPRPDPDLALSLADDRKTVSDVNKCVACGMWCGLVCPFGAMKDVTLFDPFAEGRGEDQAGRGQ